MRALVVAVCFFCFASDLQTCFGQVESPEALADVSASDTIKFELSDHEKQLIKLRIQRILEKDQQFRGYQSFGTTDDAEIARLEKLDAPDQLKAMSKSKGRLSEETNQLLFQFQRKNDRENMTEFMDIVKTFGYPSKERLGVESDDLFVLLLHPPVEKDQVEDHLQNMSKILRAEVLAGRMDAKFFATFVDNMRGKILRLPQLYGTNGMFNRETGVIEPPLIESLESANAARREIGMPELKEGEYRVPDGASPANSSSSRE